MNEHELLGRGSPDGLDILAAQAERLTAERAEWERIAFANREDWRVACPESDRLRRERDGLLAAAKDLPSEEDFPTSESWDAGVVYVSCPKLKALRAAVAKCED